MQILNAIAIRSMIVASTSAELECFKCVAHKLHFVSSTHCMIHHNTDHPIRLRSTESIRNCDINIPFGSNKPIDFLITH